MPLNPPISDWRGRRVWLLGASSGIGAALAQALARQGARLALSARRADALDEVARACAPAEAMTLPLDVRDAAAVAAAEQAIVARWGGYDVVVLLAGHYQPRTVDEFELAAAREVLAVNIDGAYHLLAAVLPRLLAAGAGALVLVSSVAGYRGLPRSLVYGPSKAALNNLAEALHLELHARGVGVTLVNPGFVRTPLTAGNPFPMPALIEPEEAAERIVAGLARGAFEIHFPRRFTGVLKALALLPASLYLPLVRWLTR